MPSLHISDVAEQTGIAAGTLRMWEQRYDFPEPERTPAGHRRYPAATVTILLEVNALREQGLSVGSAIDRARERGRLETDRPSIYATVLGSPRTPPAQLLRKSTLISMSRAIEDEAMSNAAAPVAFGAFQEAGFFAAAEERYHELARMADGVAVFADFPEVRDADGLVELPIAPEDALGNEWAVIIDAPGYAACLLAWEPPGQEAERGGAEDRDRRFEAIWTLDPEVTRQAATTAARLAGRCDAAVGERFAGLLAERPLAMERPAPALTALTNRIVRYLDDLVSPTRSRT